MFAREHCTARADNQNAKSPTLALRVGLFRRSLLAEIVRCGLMVVRVILFQLSFSVDRFGLPVWQFLCGWRGVLFSRHDLHHSGIAWVGGTDSEADTVCIGRDDV
jgi:hypothetical protein